MRHRIFLVWAQNFAASAAVTALYTSRGQIMEETTYLRAGSALVTNSRIEIDGQTFAVRNVGSVKVVGGGWSWAGALVLVIGAMVMTANPFFGVPISVATSWVDLLVRRTSSATSSCGRIILALSALA